MTAKLLAGSMVLLVVAMDATAKNGPKEKERNEHAINKHQHVKKGPKNRIAVPEPGALSEWLVCMAGLGCLALIRRSR